jgi:cytochrome c oxidase subunit I
MPRPLSRRTLFRHTGWRLWSSLDALLLDFWTPRVYILVLPAFAFMNEIIPVFSRKAIFGYPAMVAASVAIGFVSLSVWAHHMFTVGMGLAGNTFFVFATMVVSVSTP